MANPTNPNENWPDPDTERAQPGDVLGIERGGETTSLGDTVEDEDLRRRELEDEAVDADESPRLPEIAGQAAKSVRFTFLTA